MIFTSLNLEQSASKYLADALAAAGYGVYWHDTKQHVGSDDPVVTLVRDFPETPTYIVFPSEGIEDHLIRVPAFACKVFDDPSTGDAERLGIGESAFHWRAELRIDGFARNEIQWYAFQKYFTEWFSHPDIRIPIRDYQADLTNPAPAVSTDYVQLENVSIGRSELVGQDVPAAARYYIRVSATALYPE